ncbi:MAG: hypothetical protein N2044_00115 [Cyclobacteriaceae bacterium]|nr:hypothetical protein [Cyclobacteriaceae bacterium]MCX7636225.1 hypothetical protein [Cyclobacteriaceae bacterium]MDW8331403.1 hypothetical protein [Cyclobacteriaceae bacterium]
MKTSSYIFLTAVVLGITACSFSAGTKSDLKTGLSYSYYGLSLDEVYFVGPENTPLSSNEAEYGTSVALVAQGIGNYILEDNKAFPGLSLTVTGENGTLVLDEPDLLAETDGLPAEDAAILRGSLTIGDPMEPGKTYTMKIKIWDKKKPENRIEAQVPVKVISLPE